MSLINVLTKRTSEPVERNVFERIDTTLDRIRERAYELSQMRGGLPGHDLDDWFQAEQELFDVPQSEVVETETGYEVKVVAPGFQAGELSVTVEDGFLTVQGEAERKQERRGKMLVSEFSRKELFRRLALPPGVAACDVSAELDHGVLVVSMTKPGVSAPASTTPEKAEPATAAESKPKSKAAHAAA